ncbi:LuxR C-terminal-related transcriptional regulator [Mycobacterium sp. TY815]|uniref:LuxR C-terminal-related transcriptional regulator n=1 Tax=Mycobacterium sp. TY815 TaxID=3050581 RepID=UPI002742345A|nr:LuxR C-terminal-related transcriptional regulator [Mycobacterium sp. TY815]MDP7705765.1 LuxR C-terminal-related transcriptional regulator [Mycobacterium sp. TY815]
MLVTMSQHAEMPALTWGELSVSELLPTGTVTLLLADVEGSTALWESQPEQMTAALGLLNRTVDETVAAYDGVRPVEQGEGDSFVAAFARASDAVACALALQRAPLAPIRIRIGLHTGEIQLRDEGNYAGPTINRTARIRDLAHGGQTVMSGVTESLVVDRLPEAAWLIDLGSYPLRGVPRPERVAQLCHPDLRNEFPPLRVRTEVASHNLPVQLTSFVGRQSQVSEVRQLVIGDRLVTLTGAGGVGKTRLAVEVSSLLSSEFPDGIWYVDLAPITNAAVAPLTVARTLGLPDQPGRSTMELLVRFVGEKTMLLVLDNCEHLLDACGDLVVELLGSCPHATILSTSREPLGVPGELTWRVPSLSLADEAVELFADRARQARPVFVVNEANTPLVRDICERLDGMPLAIELAAARIRALSLQQIGSSLHDRFRLLTGGARTAVRRQQTLRASVDWSHALLTEPERVLFRRLAVFTGGFDLEAAQAIGAGSEMESYQLLDQLSLLVDKSLVVASETSTETSTHAGTDSGMRYSLLETVRQYAQEKLGESGEAEQTRTRHRDYYTSTATELASQGLAGVERLLTWARAESENLRTAFAWSLDSSDRESAMRLASALQDFWLRTGIFREALAAFDAVLTDRRPEEIAPSVWVAAIADQCTIAGWAGAYGHVDLAYKALEVARNLDDPALVARALGACGIVTFYNAEVAQAYFTEAIDMARAAGDAWRLLPIFSYQATTAVVAGEPKAAIAAAAAGRDLADALGDGFFSRNNRAWLGCGLWFHGDLDEAIEVLRSVVAEAEAAADPSATIFGQVCLSGTLAFKGDIASARSAAQAASAASDSVGGMTEDTVNGAIAHAALAGGDAEAAVLASREALRYIVPDREAFTRSVAPLAESLLAWGDFDAARQWADECIPLLPALFKATALTVRAYIALAQGEPEQAERDAHEALTIAAATQGYMKVASTLECLARLAADENNMAYAARLLGAAQGIRQRKGHARFPMYQAGHDAAVATVRDSLGDSNFDGAWAEGSALSIEEAIAYAQRGRGERKRPATGWASLTPTELDVVRLVAEGLGNKDVGARLFISPRTVQSHLRHVYAKLGLASRVQLVQEASRRA